MLSSRLSRCGKENPFPRLTSLDLSNNRLEEPISSYLSLFFVELLSLDVCIFLTGSLVLQNLDIRGNWMSRDRELTGFFTTPSNVALLDVPTNLTCPELVVFDVLYLQADPVLFGYQGCRCPSVPAPMYWNVHSATCMLCPEATRCQPTVRLCVPRRVKFSRCRLTTKDKAIA